MARKKKSEFPDSIAVEWVEQQGTDRFMSVEENPDEFAEVGTVKVVGIYKLDHVALVSAEVSIKQMVKGSV